MNNHMEFHLMTMDFFHVFLLLIVAIHVAGGKTILERESSLQLGSERPDQLGGKYHGQDLLSHTIRLGKLDYMLEQLNRRIESIENKLTRFEIKLDLKLEKIEESLGAKDMKEEFASDQLTRQIENLADKLINKMSFLEAKMGLRIDNINSRFERSERNLQNSLENVIEKLVKTDDKHIQAESRLWTHITRVDEITNSIVDMKTYVKDEINNVVIKKLDEISTKIDNGFQDVDQEFEIGQSIISDLNMSIVSKSDQIASRIQKIEGKYNATCEPRGRGGSPSSDSDYSSRMDDFTLQTHEKLHNLTNTMSEALRMGERNFKELDSDVEIYTKKVLYAIQELLKGSQEMETFLKKTIDHGNHTRLIVRDGFEKISQQLRPLTGLKPKIEDLDALQKKILDLSKTVDKSFASLLVGQNTFINSCYYLQQKQPEMESKIYTILQEIKQNLQTGNGASDIDAKNLHSIILNHNTEVGKALNDLVWTLLNVGNQTKRDIGIIMNRISLLLHRLSTIRNPSCSCMIHPGEWKSLFEACETFSYKPKSTSRSSDSSSPKPLNLSRRRIDKPNVSTASWQHLTETAHQGATMLPPYLSEIRTSEIIQKQRRQNLTGFQSDQVRFDFEPPPSEQDRGDKSTAETKNQNYFEIVNKDSVLDRHSKNNTYLGKTDNSQEDIFNKDYESDEITSDEDSVER